MRLSGIPFRATAWSSVEPTEHKGGAPPLFHRGGRQAVHRRSTRGRGIYFDFCASGVNERS